MAEMWQVVFGYAAAIGVVLGYLYVALAKSEKLRNDIEREYGTHVLRQAGVEHRIAMRSLFWFVPSRFYLWKRRRHQKRLKALEEAHRRDFSESFSV